MPQSYSKHPDELLVDALVDRFEHDLNNIVDFATVHGRLIFTVPLTDEEKWQRFANPESRAMVMDKVLRTEGPDAVKAYINSMLAIAKSLANKVPE